MFGRATPGAVRPAEDGMAHYFEIKKNKAGEFVAYFKYNAETIFWFTCRSDLSGLSWLKK